MNKKHGFTVSELLISIAIISIVSAMGMTIAKRGTDDAYKNYFAVGTMNLNNALAQIETGEVNVQPTNAGNLQERTDFVREDDGRAREDANGNPIRRKMPANISEDIFLKRLDNNGNWVPLNDSFYKMYDRNGIEYHAMGGIPDLRGPQWITNCFKYLFGDTNIKITNNACNGAQGSDCVINAGNGITYEITEIDQNGTDFIRIMMTVPAQRTRQNPTGRARTEFLYCRNANAADRTPGGTDIDKLANSHMLIPLDSSILNNRADLQNIPYVNLQDREDLLTAYIDDGVVGRHVPRYNNEDPPEIDHYDFMPIRYGTFRDSLCSILNDDPNDNMANNYLIDNNTIVNCQQYDDNNAPSIHHERAVHLFLDNAGNLIQNRDAVGNIIGTAPDSGSIKFASPRKLK